MNRYTFDDDGAGPSSPPPYTEDDGAAAYASFGFASQEDYDAYVKQLSAHSTMVPTPSRRAQEEADAQFARMLQEEEEKAYSVQRQEEDASQRRVNEAVSCRVCGTPYTQDPWKLVELRCGNVVCQPCLKALRLGEATTLSAFVCPVIACKHQLSEFEMRQFDELALASFERLSFSSEGLVQCPSCACQYEVMAPTADALVQAPHHDANGRELSVVSREHYAKARVRCPQCNVEFCSECNRTPYHLGLTCDMVSRREKSTVCRFCENLTGSDADVCTSQECVEKAATACQEVMQCGYRCCGMVGEREAGAECVGCLRGDCATCRNKAVGVLPCGKGA